MQALPSEIWLYLIGDDISLDDIAQKADAIYAELKYNSQSSCASDTKSPNLQLYETAPNQESNLNSCDMGLSAENYGNVKNLTTALVIIQAILITGDDLTITIHVIVIVVLSIPTTGLSCAGTTTSMVLSKLGNAMENLVLCSLV